ncbi:4631_t:CDS:2 [Funneliformis mosseae]|uniref:4631_t:CDS:1 n=1 Tax=Funneliformis mosseae TaxID=27381 RepID=A0A9N8VJL6_FUNMO|nr:4631_t:CDS:2 [Funneliformis mosseae]
MNFDPEKITPEYHIQQAEQALTKLKSIIEEADWKKVLHIKSGVAVFSKNENGDDEKLPIFMSEHIIENFTPHAIFAVVGMRKLWDPWYEEGNLVENLDSTTSLTYMTMQVLAGTRTRDLCLVEKIEYTTDGTIYFAATSVQTPKVPRVSERIRAHLNLNGWVIQPISQNPLRTKITYVLQSKAGGWVPSVVSRRYLIRRPLVIYAIDQYLQKNGPTPVTVSSATNSNRPSRRPSIASSFNSVNVVHKDLKHNVSKDRIESHNKSYNRQIVPPTYSPRTIKRDTIEEIPDNSYDNDVIKHFSSPDTPESQNSPTLATTPRRPINKKPTTPPTSSLRSQTSLTSLNGKRKKSVPSPLYLRDDRKETFVSPQPAQKKHRYKNVITKAIAQFKENVNSMDGWLFYNESKGVKIYTKDVEGRSFPIIRGDYTLSGGFTAFDCLSVLKNLSLRKSWDDRFDGGENIENLSNTENLSRVSMKGTFPISGRDFALFGTVEHDPETGKIVYVTTSIIDSAIPEVKKYVRAHITFAGWQMVPNFDYKGKTETLSLIYIVDSDVKIDSIPTSILKSLSTGTPMVIQKIDEMLHDIGFPPYVLKSTSLIISEDLDPNTFQGELSLVAESNSVTEIRFSRKMYPNGFILTVNPDSAKVELLPDNSDTIRLTLPSKVDTKKLHITITKSTSRGFKLTYNEGKVINEVPKDTNNEVGAIPVTKSRKANNEIKTTRLAHSTNSSANSTLVANRRNIVINALNDQLTDNNEDLSRIPAINTRRIVSPDTFQFKEVHIQDSQDSQDLQKTYQRLDGKYEKLEDETEKHVESLEKYKRNSDNNEIFIISENVKFNLQEICLMFAAMLLSYYAGKVSVYLEI